MRALLIVSLLGCVGPTVDVARSALVSCPTPTPDDGVDDTADVQAAIDLRCPLAVGVYDIDMAPTPPVGRRRYNMLIINGGELSGPGATLRFRGDAGRQDWRGVELIGAGSYVHDIHIDTMQLTGTVEQTHALHITGPALSPRISNVSFSHGYRGLDGGDCIQFVGYTSTLIVNAEVSYITGDCDRSAVAMHSGVDGLHISYVTAFAGDQVIDGEGSGEGSRDWLIERNVFSTRPGDQGAFGLQLQLTDDVRVTENVFDGRGIVVYGGSRIEIDHNDITRRASSNEGAVELIKAVAGLDFHDNRVERTSAAGTGPVFHAVQHGTGSPAGIRIADTRLIQRGPGNVIDVSATTGLTVERVTAAYLGPAGGWYGVSALASPTVQTTGLVVRDSVFAGPLLAVMRVSGSYAGTGTLASNRNVSIGAPTGIKCENASGITGPVTSVGDAMPGSCPMAVVSP
jgi:hypothetical protein